MNKSQAQFNKNGHLTSPKGNQMINSSSGLGTLITNKIKQRNQNREPNIIKKKEMIIKKRKAIRSLSKKSKTKQYENVTDVPNTQKPGSNKYNFY